MGATTCSHCRRENSLEAAFCAGCGRPLNGELAPSPPVEPIVPPGAGLGEQYLKCPRCFSPNDPYTRHCLFCGLALSSPEAARLRRKPGGFFARAAALVLDAALCLGVGLLLAKLVGWAGTILLDQGPMVVSERVTDIIILTYTVAYHTIFLGRYGRTLGKRFFSLRVVRVDGNPVGYLRSLVRLLCYLPSLWFIGLGFWWTLLNYRKRGWHDYLAGTMVLKTDDR